MVKLLINPYTAGPPVMGGSFYGRDKLLTRVGRSLRLSNVVVLQGQRRIGKTSFLRQLAHFLSHEQPEATAQPLRVPVIFDIQRYVQDTLPQFQMHLAGAIVRAIELFQEMSLIIPDLTEWEANPALFQDRWLPQVQEHLANRELVILVDEFDNFDEQIAPQAMQTLIPFLGQLVVSESWLRWVFTLGRLGGKMSLAYDRIVSAGEEFRLTFLSLEETRQLIVAPAAGLLTYQSGAIERIYQLTSGQPHLTQALCSKLFDHLLEEERDRVTAEDVDAIIPQTLEAYTSAIASIVSVLGVEKWVLAAVAQLTDEGTTTSRDDVRDLLVKNSVPLSRDDLRTALNSLMEWELLTGDLASLQSLQFTVELVRRWVAQNSSVEPSRQESLDILDTFLNSRLEVAEKARKSEYYDLAIKEYLEVLEYAPDDIQTLRRLAEIYRLNGDFEERITTLQKLSHSEPDIALNELVKALAEYARHLEKEKNFLSASEQYKALLELQDDSICRHRLVQSLMINLEKNLEQVEGGLELKVWNEKHEAFHNLAIAHQAAVKLLESTSDWTEAIPLKKYLKTQKKQLCLALIRVELLCAKNTEDWDAIEKRLSDLKEFGIKLSQADREKLNRSIIGNNASSGQFLLLPAIFYSYLLFLFQTKYLYYNDSPFLLAWYDNFIEKFAEELESFFGDVFRVLCNFFKEVYDSVSLAYKYFDDNFREIIYFSPVFWLFSLLALCYIMPNLFISFFSIASTTLVPKLPTSVVLQLRRVHQEWMDSRNR